MQSSHAKLSQATNRFALFAGGLGLVAQSVQGIQPDDFMVAMDEATAALKTEAAVLQSGVSALSAQNADFDAIRAQWGRVC